MQNLQDPHKSTLETDFTRVYQAVVKNKSWIDEDLNEVMGIGRLWKQFLSFVCVDHNCKQTRVIPKIIDLCENAVTKDKNNAEHANKLLSAFSRKADHTIARRSFFNTQEKKKLEGLKQSINEQIQSINKISQQILPTVQNTIPVKKNDDNSVKKNSTHEKISTTPKNEPPKTIPTEQSEENKSNIQNTEKTTSNEPTTLPIVENKISAIKTASVEIDFNDITASLKAIETLDTEKTKHVTSLKISVQPHKTSKANYSTKGENDKVESLFKAMSDRYPNIQSLFIEGKGEKTAVVDFDFIGFIDKLKDIKTLEIKNMNVCDLLAVPSSPEEPKEQTAEGATEEDTLKKSVKEEEPKLKEEKEETFNIYEPDLNFDVETCSIEFGHKKSSPVLHLKAPIKIKKLKIKGPVHNILVAGRSRSGKSNLIKSLGGDFKSVPLSLYSKTKNPSFNSLILKEEENNNVVQVNLIDTPGLYEVTEQQSKEGARDNPTILNNINTSVNNFFEGKSFNDINCVLITISVEEGLTSEDANSIGLIMDHLTKNGMSKTIKPILVVTRCEDKDEEQMEKIRKEINQHKSFVEIKKKYDEIGVMFSGSINSDTLENNLEKEASFQKEASLELRQRLVKKITEKDVEEGKIRMDTLFDDGND